MLIFTIPAYGPEGQEEEEEFKSQLYMSMHPANEHC